MKTVFTILFLCSAALTQEAAVAQSSEHSGKVTLTGTCTTCRVMDRAEVTEVIAQFIYENCWEPLNPTMANVCGELRHTTQEALIEQMQANAGRAKALTDEALAGKSDCKCSCTGKSQAGAQPDSTTLPAAEKTKKHSGEASR